MGRSLPRPSTLLGIAVAGYALVRYVLTMAPTVSASDPGELQVLSWALGIPHATGYPLFIWLGKLFTCLPFGDLAHRVTLLSVVSGAAATAMIYANGARLAAGVGCPPRDPGRWLAAGAAALGFASSYTFWSTAIVCEMYTLHVFLLLVVVALALRWSREQADWQIIAAVFTWGAMLGNHLSSVALAPALGLFALVHRPRQWLDPRRSGKVLGALLLGGGTFNVLLFFLLFRRHVPFDQFHTVVLSAPELFHAEDRFWPAWWYTVSGGQFKPAMNASADWQRLQLELLPHRFIGQFYPIGAGLAVVGWLLLWRRWWRANLLLTTIFVTQIALNMHFEMWKVLLYYVTPYACAALWIAVALGWGSRCVSTWLAGRMKERLPRIAPALSCLTVGLIILALFAANLGAGRRYLEWLQGRDPDDKHNISECLGRRPDESERSEVRDRARQILDRIPSDAIVFASWRMIYPLEYVARIERHVETLTVYEAYPAHFGRNGPSSSTFDIIRDNRGRRPLFLVEDPSALPLPTSQVLPGLWRID
jgi:hypothetical protein